MLYYRLDLEVQIYYVSLYSIYLSFKITFSIQFHLYAPISQPQVSKKLYEVLRCLVRRYR